MKGGCPSSGEPLVKPTYGWGQRILIFAAFAIILSMQMRLWLDANKCSVYLVEQEFSSTEPLPPSVPVKEAASESSLSSPPAPDVPPFRMLLGIFSVDNESGKERRDLIRRTYLSLPGFLERHNVTTVPLRHARICSLEEYWHRLVDKPEECQLLYTFVMGAIPMLASSQEPVEYLILEPGRPMVVDPSDMLNGEKDATYLNIRENMEFGKTNTWFKYASTQIPNELDIHLIGKVDTDCLVYPNWLLADLERQQSNVTSTSVYGGSEIHNAYDHHYMQGGFYFLSRSLAGGISNGRTDRWNVIQEYMPKYRFRRPEDVETGQLVKAFGGNDVVRIDIPDHLLYRHHADLKHADSFLHEWDKYGSRLIARDRMTKIQAKYNSHCLSKDVLAQEQSQLDLGYKHCKWAFEALAASLLEECQNQTVALESK